MIRMSLLVSLLVTASPAAFPQSTGENANTPVNPRTSIETIQFQSKLISATLPYNVILPRDYRASRTTRYPVLYLLHGQGGLYTVWLTRPNLADYAAQYGMIVVMPSGNSGWYVDGASFKTVSGSEQAGDKYESYMIQELIPDVDKHYRTIQ